MSHYEERLEADLKQIRARVGDLAERVERALRSATAAMLRGDNAMAYATVLGDNPINRASRDVDRLCHAFIARHLPSAGHLRMMSSVIRVNVALERIGDYAVTICRESVRLSRPPGGGIAKHIHSIAEEAQDLLKRAVDGFSDGNSELARSLMPASARIEHMMDDVYDELIEGGREREPRELVAVFVIFSLLKRISDQAKNICDQTVFAVDGELKPDQFFRILFIDRDNASLSQMAEAIARKRFPSVAGYSSAGKQPADAVNPAVEKLLEERGIDTAGATTQSLESLELDLSKFNIIIALDGRVRDYLAELPFHTSGLDWDLAPLPSDLDPDQARQALENMYRDLVLRLDELMAILVGEHAG